jgi:hypothetical protein
MRSKIVITRRMLLLITLLMMSFTPEGEAVLDRFIEDMKEKGLL